MRTFIYLLIYYPRHMIFNNVIVEDTDQLSNLHGIVGDHTGRSMYWLASSLCDSSVVSP